MNLFKEKARALELAFGLEIEDNSNPFVIIDQVRTQQILTTMIRNSLKFSQHGQSIIVSMMKTGHEEDTQHHGLTQQYNIMVTDNGPCLKDREE
jgi:signal transduction histidine kinase